MQNLPISFSSANHALDFIFDVLVTPCCSLLSGLRPACAHSLTSMVNFCEVRENQWGVL